MAKEDVAKTTENETENDLQLEFRHTEDEAKDLSLWEKLVEIRRSCNYLQKSNQGHQFRYVGSSQVLGAFRKAMDHYGVMLVPHVMKTQVSDHTTKKGDHRYFTEIWIKYVWLNAHNSDQILEVQWYGQGIDEGEKGPGKAYTYAEKYMMLKIFQVATDKDDPDNFQTPPGNGNQPGNRKPPGNQGKNQGKPPAKKGNGKDDDSLPATDDDVQHVKDLSDMLRAFIGKKPADDWLKETTKWAVVKFDKKGHVTATRGQLKKLYKEIRNKLRDAITIQYTDIMEAFKDKDQEKAEQTHEQILASAAELDKQESVTLDTMSLKALEGALNDLKDTWHKEVG